MNLKYSLGLDVSSKKIDCSISTIDEHQQVVFKSKTTISNTFSGFEKLKEWIGKHHKEPSVPLVVCMKATGVYHENCALYLFEKQYKVSIVLPNKAKKYLESLGLKSKESLSFEYGYRSLHYGRRFLHNGKRFLCCGRLSRFRERLPQLKNNNPHSKKAYPLPIYNIMSFIKGRSKSRNIHYQRKFDLSLPKISPYSVQDDIPLLTDKISLCKKDLYHRI